MPLLAIRVTTPDGEDMYLREGARAGEGPIATFRSRPEAVETVEFIKHGLDEGMTVAVIPLSAVPAEERA